MTIEIKKNADETVIRVVGQLDTVTAPVLEKTIDRSAQSAKSVVLELNGLEYISDDGLFALLKAHRQMRKGCSLQLKGIGSEVMAILQDKGFAKLLPITP